MMIFLPDEYDTELEKIAEELGTYPDAAVVIMIEERKRMQDVLRRYAETLTRWQLADEKRRKKMESEPFVKEAPERRCIMTFVSQEDYHKAELWAVQEGVKVDDLFEIWLHEREAEYARFRENMDRLTREVRSCL